MTSSLNHQAPGHEVCGASKLVITGTGFNHEERSLLCQAVTQQLGARYLPDLVHRSNAPLCHTTHLVCKSLLDAFGTPKYTRALEWGVPVISWHWVMDSIQHQALQPVEQYKTDRPQPFPFAILSLGPCASDRQPGLEQLRAGGSGKGSSAAAATVGGVRPVLRELGNLAGSSADQQQRRQRQQQQRQHQQEQQQQAWRRGSRASSAYSQESLNYMLGLGPTLGPSIPGWQQQQQQDEPAAQMASSGAAEFSFHAAALQPPGLHGRGAGSGASTPGLVAALAPARGGAAEQQQALSNGSPVWPPQPPASAVPRCCLGGRLASPPVVGDSGRTQQGGEASLARQRCVSVSPLPAGYDIASPSLGGMGGVNPTSAAAGPSPGSTFAGEYQDDDDGLIIQGTQALDDDDDPTSPQSLLTYLRSKMTRAGDGTAGGTEAWSGGMKGGSTMGTACPASVTGRPAPPQDSAHGEEEAAGQLPSTSLASLACGGGGLSELTPARQRSGGGGGGPSDMDVSPWPGLCGGSSGGGEAMDVSPLPSGLGTSPLAGKAGAPGSLGGRAAGADLAGPQQTASVLYSGFAAVIGGKASIAAAASSDRLGGVGPSTEQRGGALGVAGSQKGRPGTPAPAAQEGPGAKLSNGEQLPGTPDGLPAAVEQPPEAAARCPSRQPSVASAAPAALLAPAFVPPDGPLSSYVKLEPAWQAAPGGSWAGPVLGGRKGGVRQGGRGGQGGSSRAALTGPSGGEVLPGTSDSDCGSDSGSSSGEEGGGEGEDMERCLASAGRIAHGGARTAGVEVGSTANGSRRRRTHDVSPPVRQYSVPDVLLEAPPVVLPDVPHIKDEPGVGAATVLGPAAAAAAGGGGRGQKSSSCDEEDEEEWLRRESQAVPGFDLGILPPAQPEQQLQSQHQQAGPLQVQQQQQQQHSQQLQQQYRPLKRLQRGSGAAAAAANGSRSGMERQAPLPAAAAVAAVWVKAEESSPTASIGPQQPGPSQRVQQAPMVGASVAAKALAQARAARSAAAAGGVAGVGRPAAAAATATAVADESQASVLEVPGGQQQRQRERVAGPLGQLERLLRKAEAQGQADAADVGCGRSQDQDQEEEGGGRGERGGVEVAVLKALARPPRGSTAKDWHGLASHKGLEWAESAQVLPLGVTIACKERAKMTKCPIVLVRGRRGSEQGMQAVVAEPWALYRKDGDWWLEFHRMLSPKDVQLQQQQVDDKRGVAPLPGDLAEGHEVLRALQREHARLADVHGEVDVVRTKKLPTRGKLLPTALYQRYVYDTQARQVLTDAPASDFVVE